MARTHTICAHPNESKYNTKLVKIRNKSLNFNGTQLKKKNNQHFHLAEYPIHSILMQLISKSYAGLKQKTQKVSEK